MHNKRDEQMKLGLYTRSEARKVMCISESTLFRYVRLGYLAQKQINDKQTGFEPEDIQAFMLKMRNGDFRVNKRDGNHGN
jgi:hypothetical protein